MAIYTEQAWADFDNAKSATAARFAHIEDGITAATHVYNFDDPRWGSTAKLDGTDESTRLQAAIDYLAGLGSAVLIIPYGSLGWATPPVWRSGVYCAFMPGTSAKWLGGGGAGTSMFLSDTAQPLVRAGVIAPYGRARINPTPSANCPEKIFNWPAAQDCCIAGWRVQPAIGAEFVAAYCTVGSTTGSLDGNKNWARNLIANNYFEGITSICKPKGVDSTAVVTLNEFNHMQGKQIYGIAYDLVQWCDSNTWSGMHQYAIAADNGRGIRFNGSTTPDTEVGVYDSHFFGSFFVDTWVGSYVGRVALEMNYARGTIMNGFANNPAAEGGSFVDNYPLLYNDYEIREVNRQNAGGQYVYHKNIQGRMRTITAVAAKTLLGVGDLFVLCDCSGGAFTLTLPPANNSSQRVFVKKIDSSANNLTVARAGTDTIQGANTVTLTAQYQFRQYVSGGAGVWYPMATT